MNVKTSEKLQNFKTKLKIGFGKYDAFVRKFVYTDFYLALVAVITFIGWVTECAPFGISVLSVIACLALISSDDILPLTSNIFGAMLVIYTSEIDKLLSVWPVLLLLIPGFAVFIARNCRHKFRTGKMFYPQIAVSLALILGGAGVVSAENYAHALPTALILGLGVLVIYIAYNHFLKRDGEHDIPTYFSKVMMYLGIVICLELLVVIIRSGLPASQWHTSYWDVGWGNRNNISTYLIITAGFTMFLSAKSRYGFIYLAVALAQYACIVLTFSRGGIIFGAISGIMAFILAIVKSENRKRALISSGIVIGIALILYLIFMDKINTMIGSLLARGMGTSNRDKLYAEAWECFKNFPFLGVGLGYRGNNFDITVMDMYWFHSTLFEVIAAMGLVGVAAYVWYYAARIKLLFKNIKNTFNLFVLAVWIGFEGYCMIDAGTFIPYPNMMLIIVTALLLEVQIPCKKDDYYHLTYSRESDCEKAQSDESAIQSIPEITVPETAIFETV